MTGKQRRDTGPTARHASEDPLPAAAALHRLVAAHTPGLFAVGAQYDGEDCAILAWGLAFPEHTEVVSVDGCHHVHTTSPERALRHFQDTSAQLHLVWAAHRPHDADRQDRDRP